MKTEIVGIIFQLTNHRTFFQTRQTRFPQFRPLQKKVGTTTETASQNSHTATAFLLFPAVAVSVLSLFQHSPFPNMTTDNHIAVRSPPNSPPAKRVKTAEAASITSTITNATTQDTNGTAVPVTKMSQTPRLLIKKLSEKARLPTRGSAFAAGYDIYASKATVIPARGKALVDTDISMAVPAGTCKPPITPPSF